MGKGRKEGERGEKGETEGGRSVGPFFEVTRDGTQISQL